MEKITENEFKQMTDGMRVEKVADCLCELNKGIGYKIYTLLIAENEKTYETKYFCKIKNFFYAGSWQEGGEGVALYDLDFTDYFAILWSGYGAQIKNTKLLKKKLEKVGLDIVNAPCMTDTQTWNAAFDKNWYSYKNQKAFVHDMAVEWQYEQANSSMYWSEVAAWNDEFTKLGKRYGLLEEFRENGII